VAAGDPPEFRLRVVLDTTISIRGFLKRSGGSALILNTWRQHRAFALITCRAAVSEFLRVLAYPRIRKKYKIQPSEVHAIAKLFYKRAEWVTPTGQVHLCRDDTDDFILETAILGKADYLVTTDDDMLDDDTLKDEMKGHGVEVVNVGEFINVLRERQIIE
jgi:hypothetical protein